MALTLTLSTDSNYGISGVVSVSTSTASVTISVGSLVQLYNNMPGSGATIPFSWNNQTGFAGYFTPGSTYTVNANDNFNNTTATSITLPNASLTLTFTTGSYTTSTMNTLLGTSYTGMVSTWAAGQVTYVLSGATGQTIQTSALADNSAIKTVKDYGTVSAIGNAAFLNCNNLTSVIIPYTQTLGNSVFEACRNLAIVNIASVVTAGSGNTNGPFLDCPALTQITMRGSTSTQSLFGSIPPARYILTYVIGSDTWPQLTMAVGVTQAYTGTTVQVVSTGTNLPDGWAFTASVYSSLLTGYFNTTTFFQLSGGNTTNSITIPNGIPNTDTVYISYSSKGSLFPESTLVYDGLTKLYSNVPVSAPITIIPTPTTPITYTAPSTVNSYVTLAYGTSADILPLNVTGVYNTASILSTATFGPYNGTAIVVSSNVIEYTPNPTFDGVDQVVYTVTGPGNLTSNSSTIFITVPAPSISLSARSFGLSGTTFAPGRVGGNFIGTFTAAGGTGPYIYQIANGYSLPPGLTLTNTNSTAVITGTFTTIGSYNYAIQATDSSTPPASGISSVYSQQVYPSIPNGLATTFATTENASSATVALNFDNPPISVAVVSAPSHGTAIANGASITYKPNAGYSGSDSFTFHGTNISGTGLPGTVTVTVAPNTLVLSPPVGTTLTSGRQKQSYIPVTLSASGGYGAYTFSATGLPPGLSISASGVISGTPTTQGVYTPTITVHDSGTPNVYTSGGYVIDVLSGPSLISTSSYDLLQQATLGIAQLKTNLYGIPTLSKPITRSGSAGGKILASQWTALYNDIEQCNIHQNGASAVATPVIATTGSTIFAISTTTLLAKVASLTTNYKTVSADQLSQLSHTYSFTTSTQTIFGYTYSWPSTAIAQNFFNLGGSFTTGFDSTKFDVNNYQGTTPVTVNGSGGIAPPGVTGGTIQVFIESVGNQVSVLLQCTPTSGSITVNGNIYCNISNALTGGLAAVTPNIQVANNNGLNATPSGALALYGNQTGSQSFQLTAGASPIVISNVTPVNDPTQPSLTFGWTNPGVIAPNTSKTLTVTWANNNVNSGGGFYNNSIVVASSDLVNPSLTISTPIQAYFGITATPSVSISGSATESYYIPYTITGYGGQLNPSTVAATVSGSGYQVLPTTVPQNYGYVSVPASAQTAIGLNTLLVGNGTASGVATFSASDTSGDYATTTSNISLTVNATDRNLGTWLSPLDANNAVVGMSYDIINGQRCLTIGVGMGSGGSYQMAVSQAIWKSPAIYVNHSIKQLNGRFTETNAPFAYAGTSTNSAFLPDYGIWNASTGTTTLSTGNHQFLARSATTYAYQLDATGSASVTIDGTSHPVGTGTLPLSAGFHTVSITSTDSVNPSPAVGFRIYDPAVGYNSWSTLDVIIPNWAEISRVYLTGNPQTYQTTPNIYNGRQALGQSYSSLFVNGSMFSINDNGYGDLNITINALNSLTGDALTDQTLANLPYIFYYYSLYENSLQYNSRYSQLTPGDNNTTPYFAGFDRNGNVVTTTVATPQASSGSGSDPFQQLVLGEIASILADIVAGQILPTLVSYTVVDGVTIVGGESTFNATGSLLYDTYNYVAGVGANTVAASASAAAAQTLAGYDTVGAAAGYIDAGYSAAEAAALAAEEAAAAAEAAATAAAVEVTTGSALLDGVVAIAAAASCFTADTIVTMEDGTTKRIDQVKIGERVYNYNKSKLNTVKFIEIDITPQLMYSPSADYKAFATTNHPLYIDGVLSSIDPDKNYNEYPWLGKNNRIVPTEVVATEGAPVYNLWLDGDHTYIVNGYGTHSIVGDGGWAKILIEQNIITRERMVELFTELTTIDKYASHGIYSLNKLLGWLNIKLINHVVGGILNSTEPTVARRAVKSAIKACGFVMCKLTGR